MKSFVQYLNEVSKEGKGLTVFDIDETLFRTFAMIKVVDKQNKIIASLDNQEFNTYKKDPDHHYDFGEFKNADKFANTSIPIKPMIAKLKAILKNATNVGSKVILMTARADFDDKDTFLNKFRQYNININNIYVERAGNLSGQNPAANKKLLFNKYLSTNEYKRIRLYDDSLANIKALLSLQKKFPDVSFEGHLVDKAGKSKQIRS